mgnify:CR=1 FL=1
MQALFYQIAISVLKNIQKYLTKSFCYKAFFFAEVGIFL